MSETIEKIKYLRNKKDLPPYAKNLMNGLERAILQGKDVATEISANSFLMVNRMYNARKK